MKSREVIEAHLRRIEQVNDVVNAVTVSLAEQALPAADEADEKLGAGEPVGLFHGVPFSVKENIDVAGSATTSGIPMRAGAVPPLDSVVVRRMTSAGAIPLARTNMPEAALRISTNNPLHGLTRNPWNPEITAGGSSGGEAAALASGMTPIGLGNDFGGSLRNPAFCCGVTSLRPTSPGRIPRTSSIEPIDAPLAGQIMMTDGPMARSVQDIRIAFEILSGWHPEDPRSVTAPIEAPEAPRRAALATEIDGSPICPELREAVLDAASALEEAGYDVVEAQPPEWSRVHDLWARFAISAVASQLPTLQSVLSEPVAGWLARAVERYLPDESDELVIHSERSRLGREWSAFFQDLPVLVCPVWTDLPFPHEADLDVTSGLDLFFDLLRPATVGNFLGIPSVAVPTGARDGIPLGVQIYSERWCEERCLDAALAIENQFPPITPVEPVE